MKKISINIGVMFLVVIAIVAIIATILFFGRKNKMIDTNQSNTEEIIQNNIAEENNVVEENAQDDNQENNQVDDVVNQNTESYVEESNNDVSDERKITNQNLGSQIIIVSASGSTAEISMLNKDDSGNWNEILNTSGYIGKNGVGKTREGDMKTPTGTYKIIKAFGIKDDPGTSLPYTKVDESYYWVDDSNSAYYNKFVSTNDVQMDWNSAENIVEEDVAYRYVLALDYNSEGTPGLGSAIFIHVSKGRPTAGCISVSENDMIQIMRNIKSDCTIIIDRSQNIDSYLN